jgi:hypothetical protein
MRVIDADPELLRRSAEAAAHSAQQGLIHVEGEKADDVPGLLQTLSAEGPYAFVLAWEVMNSAPEELAAMKIPIGTTREAVEAAYYELHKHRRVIRQLPLIDIRGAWYTFQEGETTALNKDLGEEQRGVGLVLFPVGGPKGITGELVWGPRRGLPLATSDDERLEVRRQLVEHHDEYLEALRNADVAGVLKTFTPDAQSAIRDYVNDTGTLTVLAGEHEHRAYYEALFSRFEVRSVDLLCRVVQHWYLFSEVRMTVGNGDVTFGFNTAEFLVPGPGVRFIDRVGHGTDIAPL